MELIHLMHEDGEWTARVAFPGGVIRDGRGASPDDAIGDARSVLLGDFRVAPSAALLRAMEVAP